MLSKVRVILCRGQSRPKPEQPTFARGSVERVVKLAARANIPFAGGAFRAASEVLDVYHNMGENKKAFAVLLDIIASYSDTLWEYLEAMTPDYLRESTDFRAQVARHAIASFGRDIEATKLVILKHSQGGFLRRGALSASIKEEIAQIEKDLILSHRRFKAAVLNTVVSGVHTLVESQKLGSPQSNDLQIFGAKPLLPEDVDGTTMTAFDGVPAYGLWENVVQVDVHGKRRLVKLYHEDSGGEQEFLRYIRWYGKLIRPHIPGIYGHSRMSSIPFIVLGLSSAVPLREYFGALAASEGRKAIGDVLTMIVHMRNALNFVHTIDPWAYQVIQSSMRDAVVDENGRIMVAPDEKGSWFTHGEAEIPRVMSLGFWQMFEDIHMHPFRSLFRIQDDMALLDEVEARPSAETDEIMRIIGKYALMTSYRPFTFPHDCYEEQDGLDVRLGDADFRPALEVRLINWNRDHGHDWYCDVPETFKCNPLGSGCQAISLVIERDPRPRPKESPLPWQATISDEDDTPVYGHGETPLHDTGSDVRETMLEIEEGSCPIEDGDPPDDSSETGSTEKRHVSPCSDPLIHMFVPSEVIENLGTEYFRRHARDIARTHGVAPEDLAVCMKVPHQWCLKVTCPCRQRPLLLDDRPLYLHIRTDKYGMDLQAWYSSNADALSERMNPEDEGTSQFGSIDITRQWMGRTVFMQMESWDFDPPRGMDRADTSES